LPERGMARVLRDDPDSRIVRRAVADLRNLFRRTSGSGLFGEDVACLNNGLPGSSASGNVYSPGVSMTGMIRGVFESVKCGAIPDEDGYYWEESLSLTSSYYYQTP